MSDSLDLTQAMKEYNEAYAFCIKTHESDLKRIDSLATLIEDFDKFFYEYVYVVMASGFKARVAARLTPQLVACEGSMEKMQTLFKNQRKLNAIKQVWDKRSTWKELRATFKDVDSLTNLPFIGEITKFHLARNIGLISTAKPDLHLCRWCGRVADNDSEETVMKVTSAIAKATGRRQGSVDFALWVWLMHNRGEESDCCHGGYELR